MRLDRFDYEYILWCAPRRARPSLRVVFALDARLGGIMPAAREPLLGQIKLAWWREQLLALTGATTPAEPLLGALSTLISAKLTGAQLADLIEEETHGDAMLSVLEAICGAQSRAALLFVKFARDEETRLHAGRPLASPAAHAIMALQMRLLGG